MRVGCRTANRETEEAFWDRFPRMSGPWDYQGRLAGIYSAGREANPTDFRQEEWGNLVLDQIAEALNISRPPKHPILARPGHCWPRDPRG